MPSIRDIFPSGHSLRAEHLKPGRKYAVVIAAIQPVQFSDRAKLRIAFRGKKRCLYAGATNAIRIAEQLGEDYTQWPGKMIFLQRGETEFPIGSGELVDCVEVVENPPARPAVSF